MAPDHVERIPERVLGVPADVAGRDVLELGCGAATEEEWVPLRWPRSSPSENIWKGRKPA